MSDDQDGCEWVFLLVVAYPGSPGPKPLNGCVCVCYDTLVLTSLNYTTLHIPITRLWLWMTHQP